MNDVNTNLSRRRLLVATGAVGVTAAVAAAPRHAAAQTTPAVRGPVTVGPSDPRYADLVAGLERRWVATPDSVRVVFTPAQAAAVVQEAVTTGKRLTVRGGGHCYEDFVFNAEVDIVLDLSEMTSVEHDPAHNAIAVQAGATLLDVYDLLYKAWGITLPAGQCYSVGVGGHVPGGGWGLLCRREGLVVDHLYAVEVVVVDANGRARTVLATRERDDPNRDLWWAHTGGGGGTFGVVTRYLFRSPGVTSTDPATLLPRPPAEVVLSAIAWSWDTLTEAAFSTLVRNFGDWHAANSAPGGAYGGLCAFLNLNHRATGEISLFTKMDGDRPDSDQLLARFTAAITNGVTAPHTAVTQPSAEHGPMAELATPKRWSWLTATRYLGTIHPRLLDPTLRGDHKSAYHHKGFTAAQIAIIFDRLSRNGFANPLAQVTLSSYGGQVNAVGRTDTALVHRDSAFKVLFQTSWTEAADDTANVAWLRELYEQVYVRTGKVPVANEQTSGCFVNYCDTDISEQAHNTSGVPWHTLYWGENYPRLQQTKARWDPADFFRHRQSVRLP
ncbi:FAD-binding protein [Actinokineospora sp. NBRC 105648]|uniref:FAD-binding oxidoreductase n=1 Tax=Actinokineospora sp. NBRC 105648 TaxID=3032206 RepID=UPI0024A151DC|nr:FAD-binding protein [Actinokineospora sp. NBRC 105648]GLZ36589.1 FAD-linked oxidase [Actinokineospora sp. NBRC 105648]